MENEIKWIPFNKLSPPMGMWIELQRHYPLKENAPNQIIKCKTINESEHHISVERFEQPVLQTMEKKLYQWRILKATNG